MTNLIMKMGRKTLKGDSVESIQAQHREYINNSGKGASELTASEWEPKIKDSNCEVLGHFSYNSRFWAA